MNFGRKGGTELECCRFEITWNGRGDEGDAAWDRGDGGLGWGNLRVLVRSDVFGIRFCSEFHR